MEQAFISGLGATSPAAYVATAVWHMLLCRSENKWTHSKPFIWHDWRNNWRLSVQSSATSDWLLTYSCLAVCLDSFKECKSIYKVLWKGEGDAKVPSWKSTTLNGVLRAICVSALLARAAFSPGVHQHTHEHWHKSGSFVFVAREQQHTVYSLCEYWMNIQNIKEPVRYEALCHIRVQTKP